MKKFLIKSLLLVASLISLTAQVHGQNLDSLYNKFISIRGHKSTISQKKSSTIPVEKCLTELAFSVKKNLPKYSLTKQSVLKSVLDRPILSCSIVSPSGKFTIHYDSTGNNAPAYSMTDLAIAIDSAYNFEINYLGYPAPPINRSIDADNRYHIYVTNLGNVYGYTTPEDEVTTGSHTYYTYMTIDNSFKGYYTEGINAARVTVAHEFHHAIQLGNYYVREVNNQIEDVFFYEMTSTSMEEFVYNSVNDYYDYLNTFFQSTDMCMANHNGYDYILWNLYLQKQFGYGIIKRQWELLSKNRAISAIYTSIAENNSTFSKEFAEFTKWCFYTGYRSELKDYFTEAANYPTYRYYLSTKFTTGTSSTFTVQPCSFAVLYYINSTTNDSVVVIATNSNSLAAVSNPDSNFTSDFEISSTPISGAPKIGSYYGLLTSDQKTYWNSDYILNNSDVVTSTSFNSFPYPNPFHTKKDLGNIYLPLASGDESAEADVYIYDVSMHLIQTVHKSTVFFKQRFVILRPMADITTRLGSGVYIYQLKTAQNSVTGKITIIND